MDDMDVSKLKDDTQLGVIAHMDLEDLEPKIRDLGLATKRLLAVTADLVGRLPEGEAAEYADDLSDIDDLLRHWF